MTGRPHDADPASIKRLLADQLTRPVRWSDAMAWTVANVPAALVELAPGKVLSGLMRRIDRKTKVRNLAEPEV